MTDKPLIPPDKLLQELQAKKLQNEIALQEMDKKLKEKELTKRTLLQPTSVTILVALLGLIGAAVTNYLQRSNQLEIEEKKFQYSVYQKALETKDNITAARILDFYIKAGLLPGEPGKYTKLVEEGNIDEVPTYGGIYKNVTVPQIDNSEQLTLSGDFIKGRGTEYLLSYNARERLNKEELDTIVLHCSYSPSLKGTVQFLADTVRGRASAHIFIDRDGKIIQQVPFSFMSYHAGKHNKSSIGIELINNGRLTKTDTGYITVFKRKVDDSKVVCNDAGLCWEKYPDAQIKTAYELCKLLVSQYKIRKIVGHSEIDPRKNEPGPFFPINEFRSLVE